MSIYSICRAVRKITDEELAELEEMAAGQKGYFSPLKMATMTRQHALGEHNRSVLAQLRQLRDTIKAGEKIVKRSND